MTRMDFDLEGSTHIELYQLLKVTGLCGSGGMAKNIIAGGEVEVDGCVETRKRAKIHAGQEICWEDTTIRVI